MAKYSAHFFFDECGVLTSQADNDQVFLVPVS